MTKDETEEEKDPAAVSLGRRGGKASMAKLSPEERSALAQLALDARWGPTREAKKKKARAKKRKQRKQRETIS